MDKRNAMANQLLMRGWATVDQLLHASFGEWPPRGLDIVHSNSQRVTLTDSLHTFSPKSTVIERLRDLLMVGGYARLCGSRDIFINRLQFPFGGFKQTLGHEAAHILQGDHYWRARDIMGKDGLRVLMPQQGTTSDMLMHNTTAGHFKKGFLRDAFNKVCDITGLGISYLKRGVEMQARLHEALMQGYPHWARLPQNHQEFYFAMQSLGFALTPALQDKLARDPERDTMKKMFPPVSSILSPFGFSFVSDIAKVEANLTATGLTRLWDMGMPGMYTDLIEMYGDKLGRERFGYGVNETHIYRTQHQQDHALIRNTKWETARNDDVGEYAYIRFDTLPAAQQNDLLRALDNQYIPAQMQSTSQGTPATWLFVTGAQGMKNLSAIIAATTPAPAQPQAGARAQTAQL